MEIRAKKSLGQNFLKSKQAINDIIDAAALEYGDIVLEIGPGKGALSEALLARTAIGIPSKVIAIEKDQRMIEYLTDKFKSEISNNFFLIYNMDILEIEKEDFEKIGLRGGRYKIVANIPYYITGQFLRKFLGGDQQPSKMVLMLQKEVAKRIIGKNNTADRQAKESILSISIKAYGSPKYIGTVHAKYFSPVPKVDSAILSIDDITKKFFISNNIREKDFFDFLKKGFSHKRKILAQNLEIPIEKRAKIFDSISVDQKIRAEDLSLDQWKDLYLNTRN